MEPVTGTGSGNGERNGRGSGGVRFPPFPRSHSQTSQLRHRGTRRLGGCPEGPEPRFRIAKGVSVLRVDHAAVQTIMYGVRQPLCSLTARGICKRRAIWRLETLGGFSGSGNSCGFWVQDGCGERVCSGAQFVASCSQRFNDVSIGARTKVARRFEYGASRLLHHRHRERPQAFRAAHNDERNSL